MELSIDIGMDCYLGTPSGELVALDAGKNYIFGRDPKIDFTVNDTLCSREHCRLRWDQAGAWMVDDLGSRNGTFVDGMRIEESVTLSDRGSIQIGGQRFVLFLLPPGANLDGLIQESVVDALETFEMDGNAQPQQATALNGTLEGLEDVLRFFMLTRKTGRFVINNDEHKQVWFVDGTPRHAINGEQTGGEALKQLVNATGTWVFHENERSTTSTIDLEPKEILALLFADDGGAFKKVEAYDLDKATQLQRHLLERLPEVPGYDIGVFFQGLSGLSGDFYDVTVLDDGLVMIVLGDVSGHGIQAAMVGTNALKALRLLRQQYGDLTDLLAALNEEVRSDLLPAQFITLFAALLHPPSGRMTIALAGHHAAYLVDRDGDAPPEPVGKKGLVLGIASGEMFRKAMQLHTVQIPMGCCLVQFTDGMVEASNAEGEEFGWQRFEALLAAKRGAADMKELTSQLTSGVDEFAPELDDDITVLAIARNQQVGTRAVLAARGEQGGHQSLGMSGGNARNTTPRPATQGAGSGSDADDLGVTAVADDAVSAAAAAVRQRIAAEEQAAAAQAEAAAKAQAEAQAKAEHHSQEAEAQAALLQQRLAAEAQAAADEINADVADSVEFAPTAALTPGGDDELMPDSASGALASAIDGVAPSPTLEGQPGSGLVGRTFGPARITQGLGRGGHGRVYVAEHQTLGMQVAVKVLEVPRQDSERWIKRFQAEARRAIRVSHPNVVQVFDAGTIDNINYLVMELVQGGDLEQRVKLLGHLESRELRNLVHPIAEGLAAIHDAGVIHRDIKPSNILIDQKGLPKITDLGIAAIHTDARTREITGQRAVAGTPDYMAPEVIDPDAREGTPADIYSLGATLYHLAAGRPPYQGDDPLAIMRAHLDGSFTPLDKLVPDLDPEFVEIVHACLQRDISARPSAADLLEWSFKPTNRSRSGRKQIPTRNPNKPPTIADASQNTIWLIGGAVLAVIMIVLLVLLLLKD